MHNYGIVVVYEAVLMVYRRILGQRPPAMESGVKANSATGIRTEKEEEIVRHNITYIIIVRPGRHAQDEILYSEQ